MKKTVGALLWIFSIQYFIVEAIVQHAWNVSKSIHSIYSMRFNYISDLGASTCLYFPKGSTMFVCSPLHTIMNLSFILNGILAIIGGMLMWNYIAHISELGKNFRKAGLLLMIIGSVGNIAVGLFPENTQIIIHAGSAGLLFTLTNIGPILLGIGLYQSRFYKLSYIYTILSGSVGIISFCILLLRLYHSIGIGLIERFTAYPFTIWIITSGIFILMQKIQLKISTPHT